MGRRAAIPPSDLRGKPKPPPQSAPDASGLRVALFATDMLDTATSERIAPICAVGRGLTLEAAHDWSWDTMPPSMQALRILGGSARIAYTRNGERVTRDIDADRGATLSKRHFAEGSVHIQPLITT